MVEELRVGDMAEVELFDEGAPPEPGPRALETTRLATSPNLSESEGAFLFLGFWMDEEAAERRCLASSPRRVVRS